MLSIAWIGLAPGIRWNPVTSRSFSSALLMGFTDSIKSPKICLIESKKESIPSAPVESNWTTNF